MTLNNIEFPRDESTKSLHDYLSNKNYRNLIPLALILMFAIVFHFIYLIVDALIDKDKHNRLAKESYERYEAYKKSKRPVLSKEEEENIELDIEKTKKKNKEFCGHVDFAIWSNRNLQISFLHSFICTVWLIHIIYFSNDMFKDLLSYVSWDVYLFLCFSCGYFLYDFYDIYASGYLRIEWVVCVHHWIVLLSFAYHLMNILNLGYTALALVMEFNSVFLHGRKLLKFYGFKSNSLIVKLNTVLNVVTFTLFRFGVLIFIAYGMLVDYNRVSKTYLAVIIVFTIMMSIINIVLYKRILEKDVLAKFLTNKKNARKCSTEVVSDDHTGNYDLLKTK